MRKNGVLMHITSLPSPYGIGTLGKEAYEFVDFLKKANQSYWQILPVGPTSYGDSPYSAYSTFAGNPYMIDLDLLAEEGLLEPGDYQDLVWESEPGKVDFGLLYNTRFNVLKKAADKFLAHPAADYEDFLKANADWLDDYALFMALKDANNGASWQEWPAEMKGYSAEKAAKWAQEYKERIDYYKALQYFFAKQWQDLRKYANENGVEIIGDLPIYVALDSVDAWSHPELFQFDENCQPTDVAGCPPDAFSADGQLWGNPLYKWDYHKETGYAWWIKRMEHLANLFNILRIDHFRGFDSYYAIPYGDKNARRGEWRQGPGIALFNAMKEKIGEKPIVVEDLGYLTPSVKQLLADTGYPGMKVLQFAFDSRDASSSDYLPYKYPTNSIVYTGTHDNDTIQGWYVTANPEDVALAKDYMQSWNPEFYHWDMIRTMLASASDTAIVTAQDLLGLGSEARMNIPSTMGGNWQWRALPGQLNDAIADKLGHMTKLYGRAPKTAYIVEEEQEA